MFLVAENSISLEGCCNGMRFTVRCIYISEESNGLLEFYLNKTNNNYSQPIASVQCRNDTLRLTENITQQYPIDNITSKCSNHTQFNVSLTLSINDSNNCANLTGQTISCGTQGDSIPTNISSCNPQGTYE